MARSPDGTGAATSLSDASNSVAGIRLAASAAGIRYRDRLDLVVIEIAPGSSTAGVFTQNAFCAAPVTICRQHLQQSEPRFFLINTGNANAGTGEQGRQAALRCCNVLAEKAGVDPEQVLPFSTGVIGEPLPEQKILAALDDVLGRLADDQWQAAATGIMTTDTVPKLVFRSVEVAGETVTVGGIAKGAGMIKPNMATMLGYVFTDAVIPREKLNQLLAAAVEKSFNRITVDGDTSTNDCCMLVASGASGVDIAALSAADQEIFEETLNQVFQELAMALIRDAEGASKFITVCVGGGASAAECLQVAYAVAESPLVKTACYASDPNWGRILAAVGRAGIEGLDLGRVNITLGRVPLVSGGALDAAYTEASGQAEMEKAELAITIELGRGRSRETVWTCDLSVDYVRINADYRT